MANYEIDGIPVETPDCVSREEAAAYLAVEKETAKAAGECVTSLIVTFTADGRASLDAEWKPPKFLRIRRITGRDAGQMA